jgi:exosortase/archaeosortase family protein
LRQISDHDPVVGQQFQGFDYANAHLVPVSEKQLIYVAFRKGDKVYWTRKKVALHPGETLISDGKIVVANALRIAVTGLVVQHWGVEGAQGTRHLLSGWLIFAGSLLLIFALHRLSRIFLAGKQTSLEAEEYA